MSHHCNFCNLHFTSLPAFYRHRIGEGDERRCMTEAEMFGEGLRLGEHYAAREVLARDATPHSHPEEFARYITAPVQRRRVEYQSKESVQRSHARWLFQRGVPPARMTRCGLPERVVAEVVDEEVDKLRRRG